MLYGVVGTRSPSRPAPHCPAPGPAPAPPPRQPVLSLLFTDSVHRVISQIPHTCDIRQHLSFSFWRAQYDTLSPRVLLDRRPHCSLWLSDAPGPAGATSSGPARLRVDIGVSVSRLL